VTKHNFLLGKGERLTKPVIIRSGGAVKVPTYTIAEAKERLKPMLKLTAAALDDLPADACPNDRAVAAVTLNPEYIAKTSFPGELLRSLGLEPIGSRPRRITPEKRSKGREPEPALTTELFVAGPRRAFRAWARNIANMSDVATETAQLVAIEQISAPTAASKIKGKLPSKGSTVLEVVLHSDELAGEAQIVSDFAQFLRQRDIIANLDKRFYAGGLCFLELEAPANRVAEIAQYSVLRAVRKMPALRILRPLIRSKAMTPQTITLPEKPAMDISIKAAVFDGGLPNQHALLSWTTQIDSANVVAPHQDYLDHGLAVTSAFLFGHLDPSKPVPVPFANVDHYRVLDEAPGQDAHELYEVLDRIQGILTQNTYHFINLSLGPILSVEDDDVHAWTAVLDDLLSTGDTLATVAVGNTGESDELIRLNRIQVPADCVNALAVGACDTPGANWKRASYSSIGPGRSPGLIKPDLVAFGGTVQQPFLTVGPEVLPHYQPISGTSFSAPAVLRLGAGLRAHFGDALGMLAIRALLIHGAEPASLPMLEVGRGRAPQDLTPLVLCDDDMARIVYQGVISPAKYIRASVPMPVGAVEGKVQISATLTYITATDPHHPGNYTRAGLEPVFRPHSGKFKDEKQSHANTAAFFGRSEKGLTEEELRRDAMKWENTLHGTRGFLGSSLHDPVFDIHYNSRLEGQDHRPGHSLKYAMVITVKAPRVKDLYDRIVRRYATQLEALQPVIEMPIRL
jgi:hypothetical protein